VACLLLTCDLSFQVDRHIHRLDSDLMKHEEALSLGLRPGTQPSTDAREALGHADENADMSHLQDPAGLAGGGKGALPYDTRVHHSPSRKKKGKSKSASLAPSEVPVVHTSDADGVSYLLPELQLLKLILNLVINTGKILLLSASFAWYHGRM